MYGYGREPITSIFDILQRVPQVQIYKHILGYEPREYMYVKSPVRQDTSPWTWFEWSRGILYHIDFADPVRTVRDCFQVLMDMRNINLPEAIRHLAEVFSVQELPIIFPELARKAPKLVGPCGQLGVGGKGTRKVSPLQEISFKARAFDDEDKEFWFDRYGVRKTKLIDDNVFPLIWYRFYSSRQKQWVIVRPNTISYAYTDFEDGRIKIYCPLREKKKRFMTNCGADDIGSLSKVKEGPQLVVTKSYKDCRVLRDEGVNAVWLQNEGMFPEAGRLKDLVTPFQEIIVLFDNDTTGQHASLKLRELIKPMVAETKALYVPMYQDAPVKDPSDMRYYKGRDELLRFLDLNNIYHNG
jgi:hypothetical protein